MRVRTEGTEQRETDNGSENRGYRAASINQNGTNNVPIENPEVFLTCLPRKQQSKTLVDTELNLQRG